MRHGVIRTGPPPPQPTIPHPERHPYCEFNLLVEGRILQLIEREQLERRPGDLLLMGPGVPHYAMVLRYPHQFATVYFLPGLLFEMGPERDGSRTLRRFTVRQSIRQRVVRPPAALRCRIEGGFGEMINEFDNPRLGSEMRLRATLIETLTDLLRWEERTGREIGGSGEAIHWEPVERALRFLQQHHAETIYARQVAAAAGVSESRLHILFREALGLSWVEFLRGYRIHRAAALLLEPGHNVTETALDVGFENLGHFITSFSDFMGVTPVEYKKRTLALSGKPAKN
ncbi:MAG: AraC family transcriptional regulator [Acidobacteria bacterium]|nr:AraC family transcriptional regulator [Acidobacteriota bacterium]